MMSFKSIQDSYPRLFPATVLLCSLLLRIPLLQVQSADYTNFLLPWVQFIQTHGGFAALKYNFYDYSPAYIYLLTVVAKLSINPLYTIKLLSVLFEFLLAFFVGKTLRKLSGHPQSMLMSVAFVPLIPTVLLNSSYLSQCDAVYAAFVFGAIYAALTNRSLASVLMLGLAFSFKLQTAIILPVFFVFMLQGKIKWYYFAAVPAVFVASLLPAIMAGRPFDDLLHIYVAQSDKYKYLSLNFPNIYIWMSQVDYATGKVAGILLTIVCTLATGFWIARRPFSNENILRILFFYCILIPYLLPGMHERYMYLGDVAGVLYFLYFRRNIYLPAGIIAVSLYAYIRCSRFHDLLPEWPAFLVYTATLALVATDLYTHLNDHHETTKA